MNPFEERENAIAKILKLREKASTSPRNEKLAQKIIEEEISSGKDFSIILRNIQHRLGRPDLEDKIVAFFGFTGSLAGVYALIEEKNKELVKNKLLSISPTLSIGFKTVSEFAEFHKTYKDQVKFEKMELKKVFQKLENSPDDDGFQDAEEDEFTDDCVEQCKPGMHQCGK